MSENKQANWLRALTVGTAVWWNDPDLGKSSGFYQVAAIHGEDASDEDTIILLKNEAGSEAEVLGKELCAEQPADIYLVFASTEDGEHLLGMVATKEEAETLASEVFGDLPFEVKLDVDVNGVGTTCWVATRKEQERVQLRVTLDVTYLANGTTAEELVAKLRDELEHAINRGLLTAGAEEVDSHSVTVVETQEAPSEEELAQLMLNRIERGDLALEDIPLRLARYGLMEQSAFVAEMCERLANEQGN